MSEPNTTATSRVVTIDPEDREQVIRLRDLFDDVFANVRYDGGGQTSVDLAQKALRDLLPKPKPEEPTLPGAVVRDGAEIWSLADPGDLSPWRLVPRDGRSPQWCDWDDFSYAVEILFPGVEQAAAGAVS